MQRNYGGLIAFFRIIEGRQKLKDTINIIFGNTFSRIIFILFWSAFFYAPIEAIFNMPNFLEGLDDGLIIIGLLLVYLKKIQSIKFNELKPMLIFTIWGFMSLLANQAPLLSALYSLRFTFLGMALYYMISVDGGSENDLKRIIKIIFLIIKIHILIIIIQAIFHFAKYSYTPDRLHSFVGHGGANALGFLISTVALWAFINYFDKKKLIKKLKYFLLFTFIITVIIFMGSRGCFLLLLPVLFFITKEYAQRKIKFWIPMIIVGSSLIFVFAIIFSSMQSISFLNIKKWNPIYLYKANLTPDSPVGRLLCLPYSWHILKNYSMSILLGTGPGTYGSSGGYISNAPLARNLTLDIRPSERFIQSGAASGTVTDTVISSVGVEYGIIGLILCEVAFLILFFKMRFFRDYFKKYNDPFGFKISLLASSIFMLIFFSQIVGFFWEKQYLMWPIWVLLGVVKRYYYLYNINKKAD